MAAAIEAAAIAMVAAIAVVAAAIAVVAAAILCSILPSKDPSQPPDARHLTKKDHTWRHVSVCV